MDSKVTKADKKVQEIISRKKIKDSSDRKVASEIFDKITLETLYKLSNKGYIDILNGAISTGKEANVLKGITKKEKLIAAKIYRITTSDFKKMSYYIDGDRRFNLKNKNKRQIIYSWVNKEFKNLKKLYEVGVNVPRPIINSYNILLMEFIGDEKGNPAPPVKNRLPKDPTNFFNKLLVQLKIFVNEGKLIHGDLSNFNILNHNEDPVIIDVSQSVVIDNQIAKELFERDVRTIVNEYKKLGVNTSYDEVYEYINPNFH